MRKFHKDIPISPTEKGANVIECDFYNFIHEREQYGILLEDGEVKGFEKTLFHNGNYFHFMFSRKSVRSGCRA